MTTAAKSLVCSTVGKPEEHTIQLEKNLFKIYAIDSYKSWTHKRIDNQFKEHKLDQLVQLLMVENKGYHQHIDPNESYTFFGDCDKYKGSFDEFSELLVNFLKNAYNITINKCQAPQANCCEHSTAKSITIHLLTLFPPSSNLLLIHLPKHNQD